MPSVKSRLRSLLGQSKREIVGPNKFVTLIPGSIEDTCQHPFKADTMNLLARVKKSRPINSKQHKAKEDTIMASESSLFAHYVLDHGQVGQREVKTLSGWVKDPIRAATAIGAVVAYHQRKIDAGEFHSHQLGFILADLFSILPVDLAASFLQAISDAKINQQLFDRREAIPLLKLRSGQTIDLQESAVEMFVFLSPERRREILEAMMKQGQKARQAAKNFTRFVSFHLNSQKKYDAAVLIKRNLPDDLAEQPNRLEEVRSDLKNWRTIVEAL